MHDLGEGFLSTSCWILMLSVLSGIKSELLTARQKRKMMDVVKPRVRQATAKVCIMRNDGYNHAKY